MFTSGSGKARRCDSPAPLGFKLFLDLADRDGALISTWPVIAEACSLLGQDRQALVLGNPQGKGVRSRVP